MPLAERVHVYLDVSGSMNDFIPSLYAAVRDCHDCVVPTIHLFSTVIADVTFEELARGKVITTGGNCIACVANHMEAHHVKRAIIVTDGFVGWPNTQQREIMSGVFIGVALTEGNSTLDQLRSVANDWVSMGGQQ